MGKPRDRNTLVNSNAIDVLVIDSVALLPRAEIEGEREILHGSSR